MRKILPVGRDIESRFNCLMRLIMGGVRGAEKLVDEISSARMWSITELKEIP